MVQGKNKLATTLLAVAATAAMTAPLHAVVYTEPPSDAGQTPATAQATGTNATTALTAINGTFSSAADADLYLITITNAGTFSATTVGSGNTQDTALFLFTLSGTPVATNDDDSGGLSLGSTLGAGNSLYATLAAGTYLLGISESGNEAINSATQLLFAGYPAGNTTATRGAANGLNPATLSTFNNNPFDATTSGSYTINLTSVNTAATPIVPEPSTWATLGLGGIAATLIYRRRRQQTA